MLGAVTPIGRWEWAAFGKHPAAADFIRVGEDLPIFSAFSGWLASGQKALDAGRGRETGSYSWRFWARGARKDHVLCGLFRASSDRIGRCHPLMILGTGEIRAWEKGWDLLPFLFEGLWRRMESISSGPYRAFEPLRDDLLHLGSPPSDWREIELRRDRMREHEAWAAAARKLADRAEAAMRADLTFLRMDAGFFEDPFVRVGFWHDLLFRQARRTPNAVFIGSVTEAAYLAVLNRPILTEDYVRLCTIDGPNDGLKQPPGPP
ncbi:type VI secretion system-associated protein TagF [Desulfococcus sp.]|uniref:type VI secretion system-associated protein TagF n=1 Tax=Desulfococcus sp. TaxID=2025834 RepID=UPI0035938CD3